MLKRVGFSILGIVVALALTASALGLIGGDSVSAVSLQEGVNQSQGAGTPDSIDGESGIVTTVINIILYVVGIISVIMIIFGGIKYATSAGDTGKVTQAKNTLVYAVVGLLVAVFAFALVNWVLKGVGAGE